MHTRALSFLPKREVVMVHHCIFLNYPTCLGPCHCWLFITVGQPKKPMSWCWSSALISAKLPVSSFLRTFSWFSLWNMDQKRIFGALISENPLSKFHVFGHKWLGWLHVLNLISESAYRINTREENPMKGQRPLVPGIFWNATSQIVQLRVEEKQPLADELHSQWR